MCEQCKGNDNRPEVEILLEKLEKSVKITGGPVTPPSFYEGCEYILKQIRQHVRDTEFRARTVLLPKKDL